MGQVKCGVFIQGVALGQNNGPQTGFSIFQSSVKELEFCEMPTLLDKTFLLLSRTLLRQVLQLASVQRSNLKRNPILFENSP